LGDRLVDAAGSNFNRMFNFLKIETGHCVRLQSHNEDLSYFAFSSPEKSRKLALEVKNHELRQKKKRAIEGGGSLLNARFVQTVRSQGRSLQTDYLGSGSHIN
jgi:hypothetical protein